MAETPRNTSGACFTNLENAASPAGAADSPCATPLADLRAGALKHYDEVSSQAHCWMNVIPRAINAYFDAQESAAASVPEAPTGETGDGSHHWWLAAVLNCATEDTQLLRPELRPYHALGQTTGVFDVQLGNGRWCRVAASPFTDEQAPRLAAPAASPLAAPMDTRDAAYCPECDGGVTVTTAARCKMPLCPFRSLAAPAGAGTPGLTDAERLLKDAQSSARGLAMALVPRRELQPYAEEATKIAARCGDALFVLRALAASLSSRAARTETSE